MRADLQALAAILAFALSIVALIVSIQSYLQQWRANEIEATPVLFATKPWERDRCS